MSRYVLMALCTALLLAGCGSDTPQAATQKLVKLQVEQTPEAMVERVLNGKVNIREKDARITDPARAREIMAKAVGDTLRLLEERAFLVR